MPDINKTVSKYMMLQLLQPCKFTITQSLNRFANEGVPTKPYYCRFWCFSAKDKDMGTASLLEEQALKGGAELHTKKPQPIHPHTPS